MSLPMLLLHPCCNPAAQASSRALLLAWSYPQLLEGLTRVAMGSAVRGRSSALSALSNRLDKPVTQGRGRACTFGAGYVAVRS